MTDRLVDIKILWNDGSPVTCTISSDNVDWMIAEIERLRQLIPGSRLTPNPNSPFETWQVSDEPD